MSLPFIIHTSCGHEFPMPDSWRETEGATFDCPECGNLEILQGLVYKVETQGFHQWMHDRGPDPKTGFQWPANGADTGFIEFQGEHND